MSGPNRIYKDMYGAASGYTEMDGYFTTNDSLGNVGVQFIDRVTVARTNTGEYTFTLDNAFPSMKSFNMTLVDSLGTPDYTYQVNSFSAPGVVATTHPVQTIVATWKTGANAANLPANVGVLVSIMAKKSDQGKGR